MLAPRMIDLKAWTVGREVVVLGSRFHSWVVEGKKELLDDVNLLNLGWATRAVRRL